MRVSLRAASLADAEALLPMMSALYEHEGLPFDAGALSASLRALLDDPSAGGAWLVLEGERTAGYVVATRGFSLEQGGPFLFLDELWVAPDLRGKGIGRTVLGLLEEEARRDGAGAVRVEVLAGNARARATYRSAGYAGEDRLLLTKRLAAEPARSLRPERVELRVLVKAGPGTVWDALATGPGLDAWFTAGALVEARPGGRLLFRWERWGPDELTGAYEGTVVEAEAPRRFVFRWPVDDGTYDTTVEIELEPRGEATLVRLAEHGFESGAKGLREMLNRSAGWGEALVLLKLSVEQRVRV